MTRFITVPACIAMLMGVAACSDDGLFNAHPPVPQSTSTSSYRATPATGAGTATPAQASTARTD
jgi:hypothetical protein